MLQVLSILAIVLAIAIIAFDFTVLRARRRADTAARGIERAIYLVFIVSLVLMTLSSIAMLAIGQAMHGWMLILHMSIAPLFAVAISALAILWANQSRWSLCTWIVLLAGFVVVLTAMFIMMTWFGSDWQRTLLKVHRLSSMVLLVAAAYQASRLLLSAPHAARAGD